MARKFRTPLDLDSNKIINLGTPTAVADAATKAYADLMIPKTLVTADEDIIVRKSGAPARVAKGADGDVLQVAAGVVGYGAVPVHGHDRHTDGTWRRFFDSSQMDGAGATIVSAGAIATGTRFSTWSLPNAATSGVGIDFMMEPDWSSLDNVTLFMTGDGTAGGNVRMSLVIGHIAITDLLGEAAVETFDATGVIASTLIATSLSMSSALTDPANDGATVVRMNVLRLGSDALDTYTGALRLYGVRASGVKSN